MDVQSGRRLLINHFKESQPLLVGVLPGSAGFDVPPQKRQAWLGPLQRLALTFLIATEYQCSTRGD
jgi:hypothetical protein